MKYCPVVNKSTRGGCYEANPQNTRGGPHNHLLSTEKGSARRNGNSNTPMREVDQLLYILLNICYGQ